MYCSHFGLHRPPFNNTPDPTFYYSTPEHEEALATLQYATFQRKGFVLVTGEVGAGKTLIGRMFLRQVDRNATVAVITHTNLSGRQLLAAICNEFELDFSPDASNLELSERLQNFLLDEFAKDRYVVVLLDEAQNLPTESFEELRMLGNLEADDAKLLQICILGQPELRDRLQDPQLKPMNQRLFRRFHLPSLDREHMAGYIRHRLQVAGCRREDLFTSEALDLIYAASQGTPRLVNQICDNALLTAYGEGLQQVDDFIVHSATEKELVTTPSPAPASPKTSPVIQHTTTTVPIAPPPAVPQVEAQTGMVHEAIGKSNAAFALVQQQADQITQSRAEIRSLTQQTIQAKSEQQAALDQVSRQYQAVQTQMEAFRHELQHTLDQAVSQHQSIKQQTEELAQTTVPVEALEQIRQTHLRETGQLLEQIKKQQSDFKLLLDIADQKWNETKDQVAELANESEDGGTLVNLESEFEDKLHELVLRLDQHRKHIGDLADAKLAEKMEQKLADARADLNAKISQHEVQIGSLNQQITEKLTVTEQTLNQLQADSAKVIEIEQTLREEQLQRRQTGREDGAEARRRTRRSECQNQPA